MMKHFSASASPMTAINPALDVLIIGAGFSGLALAHALNRAGRRRFCVLEKAASVGGTWRDNRYPGAACDVPSHLYSLSFAPNPNWSRLYPKQPEIEAYLKGLAALELGPGQLLLNCTVENARWDESAALWRLCSADGREFSARVVVGAMGGLHVPAWPEIPGRERFAGAQIHSARWPQALDLSGQRVVLIGTGASAVQLLPPVAQVATSVKVIQRTPSFILPRSDAAIPAPVRSAFAHVPGLRLAFRGAIYLTLEALSSGLLHPRTAFWASALARWHLKRQVSDPGLREKLTPAYAIGCKRVLVSSDYYPALCRSNVELITAPIAQIEESGVRLGDGRLLKADTLLYASGFKPLDVLAHLSVQGRDGRLLKADWQARPRSYYGLSVHGYPNWFFLLGPNSALGHNSVLYMIESQVRHILAALKRLDSARTIEVHAAAQERFMDRLDRRFPGTAWATGCKSWYLNDKGENIALWIGSTIGYRMAVRRLKLADYCVC